MATRHLLADLADAAYEAGYDRVNLESLGGVEAAQRVAAGEPYDLVFLANGALRKLATAGHVIADSVTPLVLSQVAVGVPSGTNEAASAPAPGTVAFEDAGALRHALLAADRIGYSTGPSGDALVRMIDEWGLTAELSARMVQARPGIPVAALLAQGEVDLGFQQLSELVGQPGVTILGVLPPDSAIDTVFAGGVATTADNPEAARAVLTFLASDEATPIALRHHFAQPSESGR